MKVQVLTHWVLGAITGTVGAGCHYWHSGCQILVQTGCRVQVLVQTGCWVPLLAQWVPDSGGNWVPGAGAGGNWVPGAGGKK